MKGRLNPSKPFTFNAKPSAPGMAGMPKMPKMKKPKKWQATKTGGMVYKG